MADEEGVDRKQKQKLIILGAVFALAAVIFYLDYGSGPKLSTTKAYFTDDDGKTWFEDGVDNIPPYMHNGKEAVRINVYSYANGSKTFPGFLLKFPDNVKEGIERQAKSKSPPVGAHEIAYAGEMPNAQLVKPALKNVPWEPMQSPAGVKNMTVASPDGSELDSVVPKD